MVNVEYNVEKMITVTCQTCGSQYEMPDIGVKPIMKDCPACIEADRMAKEVLGDLYTPQHQRRNKDDGTS